jgi:hypothetical protein
MSHEYEGVRRVVYGDEGMTFVPVCEVCGRFVKPHIVIRERGETLADEPNAECSKCGPTKMLFEGYIP